MLDVMATITSGLLSPNSYGLSTGKNYPETIPNMSHFPVTRKNQAGASTICLTLTLRLFVITCLVLWRVRNMAWANIPPIEKKLTQHEVNLGIMRNPPVVRSPEGVLQPSGMYRDDERRQYELKRDQFIECADIYRRKNERATISNGSKLDIDTDKEMNFKFLQLDDEEQEKPRLANVNLRQRTMRRVKIPFTSSSSNALENDDEIRLQLGSKVEEKGRFGPSASAPGLGGGEQEEETEDDLFMKIGLDKKVSEAWIRRHIVLNKFIRSARRIVLKHRLLRRLEVFKKYHASTRDDVKCEFEERPFRIINVSYGDVFAKYLPKYNPNLRLE